MEDILARGPNFIYAKEYIQNQYGDPMWQKILDDLPGNASSIWKGTIVMVGTYPFSAFKTMSATLSKELGADHETEIARMYEYIAERSLNVLYKIFFKFMNPSFVIGNYPKLWERFFTSGKVDVQVAEKGHAIVQFILPEIFLDWLPAACLGYSKKAVEMAGGKNLIVQLVGKFQLELGLWNIGYELNWQE